MRTRSYLGAALIITTLFGVSCKRTASFQTKVFEKEVVQAACEGATDSVTVKVSLECPVAGASQEAINRMTSTIIGRSFENEIAQTDIAQAMDEYVNATVEGYKATYKEITAGKGEDEQMPGMSWSDSIDGSFVGEHKDILSYVVEACSYEGGASGSDGVVAILFDRNTGEIVSEKEYFVPGYAEPMSSLLTAHLEESLPDAESYDALFVKDIAPNGNFYVTETGVTYIYSPFDIGPHSLGTIRVTLPWDAVDEFVAEKYR